MSRRKRDGCKMVLVENTKLMTLYLARRNAAADVDWPD